MLLVWLVACRSTGVPAPEIPGDPIAFSYRTPEEARRRAEDWNDAQESRDELRARAARDASAAAQGEMHASADALGDFLGRVLGRADEAGEAHAGRLALLDPRSGEVTLVEAARRGSIPLEWSPDRRRLLFAQPGDRDYQIYEYERERGTVRRITQGPPAHTQACYASEGRIVVAAADARSTPPRSRIELSRPGGRGPFEPLSEWGMEHSPTCAPDGRTVVWVREHDDARSELRLRVLEQGAQTLVFSPGRQPRYSADGTWIVFSALLQGDWRIWRVRPDGSGRAPIGRGQRSEGRPTLSRDGRFVVYVASEEPPRRHLYLRRFDGSGDRILFADGDGENPVW